MIHSPHVRRLVLTASTVFPFTGVPMALAQLGPSPGLSSATLGKPNGPAQLDGAGTASGLSVAPSGATATRALASKLSDTVSVMDFGALCDGTSDDSAAVTTAGGTGLRIAIPSGRVCNAPKINQNGIPGVFVGPGQIKTSDGTLRGPVVVQVAGTPASSPPNIVNGFSGDLSHVPSVVEHRVTGNALPLPPTPTDGSGSSYAFYNELAANVIIDYFASGADSVYLGKGDGLRTGYATSVIDLSHAGQGDAAAYFASLYVQGPNAGALPIAGQGNFIQGPAGSIIGGVVQAGAPGVYLQGLGDISLTDNGFDVAASGSTINLNRKNGTAAYGNTWMGYRVQAGGTLGGAMPDAAFSAGGPFKIGLDMVDAVGTTAAMAMSAGQRVYANAVQPSSTPFPGTITLGTEWWDFSATNGWEFVVGGSPVVSFGNANGRFTVGAGQTNTGINSTAIGGFNSVSGNYATALGGAHYLTAASSTAMGQGASDRGNVGATCAASGGFTQQGDAQSCTYTLRAVTSGTAAMRLTADGGAVSGGARNSISIPPGAIYGLTVTVVARDTTATGAWAQWSMVGGTLVRDTAGIAYVGATPTKTSGGTGSAAALAIAADTANGALSVSFTAPNADAWHVVATVRTAEAE